MPWTKSNYPPSMKNLDPRVRGKAVEIANALLEDGYEEGRSIAIATAQAKEWNEDHPLNGSASGGKQQRKRDNYRVVPHQQQWAVKKEGSAEPIKLARTKEEAVTSAKELASSHNVSAIIHRQNGTIETSHNYH